MNGSTDTGWETLPAGASARRPASSLSLGRGAGLAGALLLAGFAFAAQPLAVVALIAGAAFFWTCLTRPAWALGAFLFVHIAFPVYIRVPPSIPPSIAMLMALGGAVALASILGRRGRPLGTAGRRLVLALALFGGATLFSLLDPRITGDGVNMWIKAFLFPGVLAWIIVRTLDDETDVDRMMLVLLAAACLTACYGVYEYSIGANYLYENFMDHAATDRAMYRTDDILGPSIAYRAFSVSSQPIEFGAWLSMLFPYALVKFGRAESVGMKLVFAAACALLVLGVLATFSRGCLLATAVVCLLLGVIIRPLRIWLTTGVIVLALGLALAWPFIADKVTDRAGDADNVTLRFKLWQTALAIFRDQPIVGAGFGNFPQYQAEAVRTHRIGPFHEFGGSKADLIGVAENTYIQLAAETGLIGLTTFALFIAAFFTLAVRLARRSSNEHRSDMTICMGAGALAYLVNGLTITAYTHYVITLLLTGAMVGFLLVLRRAEMEDAPARASPPGGASARQSGNDCR